MSINRRHILTGLTAVPAFAVASNADAADLDVELLRLGAEFDQANELWQAATDRQDEAEEQGQPIEVVRAAEDETDRISEVIGAMASRIMQMRAHTPAGMLLKLHVCDVWIRDEDSTGDEEGIMLASLKADLESLALTFRV